VFRLRNGFSEEMLNDRDPRGHAVQDGVDAHLRAFTFVQVEGRLVLAGSGCADHEQLVIAVAPHRPCQDSPCCLCCSQLGPPGTSELSGTSRQTSWRRRRCTTWGGHLEALEKRRRREKQVQRGKRALFYCPVLADGCTSDSSTEEEEEEEGKAGLGRRSGPQPAA